MCGYSLCMKHAQGLSASERETVEAVARAAFANPFAEEREQIDREVVGADAQTPRDQVLPALMSRVQEVVEALRRRGLADLRQHSRSDRTSVRLLLMFELYHRVCPRLDALVKAQLEAGDEPCEVRFADPVLAEMSQLGVGTEEAERAFSEFFQLRRAYHFIAEGLVGTSLAMRRLREQLWQNVFTHDVGWYDSVLWNRMEDFSTMLLGETGTGKGTAAGAIGRSAFIPYDSRKGRFRESFTRAFVSLNLSQFAPGLLESELFGHRKGAFTGAVEQHQGVLAKCSRYGAVFLDEIGDVGLPVQIKLLQVLQERTFSPVGGHEQRRFDGRIIAATNRPLGALRERGEFRDDFYYRLCSDEIVVPSLRERIEQDPLELEQLVRHILGRQCGEAGESLLRPVVRSLRKSPGAGYAWPGNVRELEQAVRRVLIRGSYSVSGAASGGSGDGLFEAAVNNGWDARELVARYCSVLYGRTANYGQVARITGLDWRTVKKHVNESET